METIRDNFVGIVIVALFVWGCLTHDERRAAREAREAAAQEMTDNAAPVDWAQFLNALDEDNWSKRRYAVWERLTEDRPRLDAEEVNRAAVAWGEHRLAVGELYEDEVDRTVRWMAQYLVKGYGDHGRMWYERCEGEACDARERAVQAHLIAGGHHGSPEIVRNRLRELVTAGAIGLVEYDEYLFAALKLQNERDGLCAKVPTDQTNAVDAYRAMNPVFDPLGIREAANIWAFCAEEAIRTAEAEAAVEAEWQELLTDIFETAQ